MKINAGVILDLIYVTLIVYFLGYLENTTLLSTLKWVAVGAAGLSLFLTLVSCSFMYRATTNYKVRQKLPPMEDQLKYAQITIKIIWDLGIATACLLPVHSHLNLNILGYVIISKTLVYLIFLSLTRRLKKQVARK